MDFTESLKLPDKIEDLRNLEDSENNGKGFSRIIQAFTVRDIGEDYVDEVVV